MNGTIRLFDLTSIRVGREIIPATVAVVAFLTVLVFLSFFTGSTYGFLRLLVAIPAILVIYLGLLGILGQGPWRARERDSAIAILRERYARGELTKEQFDEMIDDLTRLHQSGS